VLLFVGRIQPLKAPDVVLRAAALLADSAPALRRRLLVAIVGGPSGSGLDHPEYLSTLADSLGIADVVRFESAAPQDRLVDWYRAATVTLVPSYSESFGLVALESQACATPVIAASVGGLRTAVDDGVSGALVDDHDPATWSRLIARLTGDSAWRQQLSAGAIAHAAQFSWESTADGVLDVYRDALLAGPGVPTAAALAGAP
jgi:D-inositol-3-phosphate glycosyltransferase